MIKIPRPRKHRQIGFQPQFNEFGPMGPNCHKEIIILKIEEAESLRLIDLENFDQQTCADKMNIGRTTIQRIYKEARRKVADSLINGKRIVIEDQQPSCPRMVGKGIGQGRGRHRNNCDINK